MGDAPRVAKERGMELPCPLFNRSPLIWMTLTTGWALGATSVANSLARASPAHTNIGCLGM
eukprot:9422978-Prorocentrum_lima.AAC.1